MGQEDLQRYVAKLGRLVRPHDVVMRVLTVIGEDGSSSTVQTVPQDIEDYDVFPEYAVRENTAVKLSFTDVDDAGNVSAPLEFEYTALDVTPPDAPTGLLIENVGEVTGEPESEPEPAPEPEPTPEPEENEDNG